MAQKIGQWTHKGNAQWIHEDGEGRIYPVDGMFELKVSNSKKGRFPSREAAMGHYDSTRATR